jgi:hypothetical protein
VATQMTPTSTPTNFMTSPPSICNELTDIGTELTDGAFNTKRVRDSVVHRAKSRQLVEYSEWLRIRIGVAMRDDRRLPARALRAGLAVRLDGHE